MLLAEFAPYQLLFKRPFATGHGTRTGTDAVFVRLRSGCGQVGYGEATLPPYLHETRTSVIQRLRAFVGSITGQPREALQALERELWPDAPAARAAMHMALLDLVCRIDKVPVIQRNEGDVLEDNFELMTIGAMPPDEVEAALADLPRTNGLKVKAVGLSAIPSIERIKELDDRKILLDLNQSARDAETVRALVAAVGPERLIAVEQPFPSVDIKAHAALKENLTVPVYADESIQGPEDLMVNGPAFRGVNLKLMKCGGLDRAATMMRLARASGLGVMLGSMSESSLGCTAMATLAPYADIVDLDGPWLVKNDPFVGITLGTSGRMRMPEGHGFGVRPVVELNWSAF